MSGGQDLKPPDEEWTTIAVLARPWGNRGELIADPWTSRLERFQQVRVVYLFGPDQSGGARQVEIEAARPHQGRLVLKLRGVDSIAAARELAGAELRIPRRERPQAPPGEYYHDDLVGCEVFERRSLRRIGRVSGWLEAGGSGLLEVAGCSPEQEILIPFARSVCVEINTAARRILVDLPEGLEELNRP